MPLSDGLILFFSCSSMPSHNYFLTKRALKRLALFFVYSGTLVQEKLNTLLQINELGRHSL
jgi:hypothetical protein